jgi:hypothetical protein
MNSRAREGAYLICTSGRIRALIHPQSCVGCAVLSSSPRFLSSERTMSIGFRMKTVEDIRSELARMTDAQLTEHGKALRAFCKPTPGRGIDKGWLMQLNEARAEWRRRHPPKKLSDEVSG